MNLRRFEQIPKRKIVPETLSDEFLEGRTNNFPLSRGDFWRSSSYRHWNRWQFSYVRPGWLTPVFLYIPYCLFLAVENTVEGCMADTTLLVGPWLSTVGSTSRPIGVGVVRDSHLHLVLGPSGWCRFLGRTTRLRRVPWHIMETKGLKNV